MRHMTGSGRRSNASPERGSPAQTTNIIDAEAGARYKGLLREKRREMLEHVFVLLTEQYHGDT
jgi:hypothetical protein